MYVAATAGVQAQAAAVVMQHLDPLQQPLADLHAGVLAGDWEGALELVGRVVDALRQVWAQGQGSMVACILAAGHVWMQPAKQPVSHCRQAEKQTGRAG
jgi:crotonobetainyl-CoA:carnitine CoA-transferase CaiB-like acyl-CoA transferase